VIQPASTDEVYVPQYDPWVVYGSPLAVFPGWSPHPGLYGPGIAFGLGFGVGLFAGYGWGWNHWGCDWHGGGALYNRESFISHSRSVVNRASARNDFHSAQMNHGNHFIGRSAGHGASRAGSNLHASVARHSSGSNRFGHGGIARTHSFFHSGGFHGGGFHGGHGGQGGGYRR
jgi:hypothetical protein